MRLQQYVQKGSFYKAVVEDGSDIIFVVDYTGKIHYHNTSVHETLGYRSNSLINKNIFDYIRPGEELVEQPFQRLIEADQLMAYPYDGFTSSMDTFKDKQHFDELYAKGKAPWEVWLREPSWSNGRPYLNGEELVKDSAVKYKGPDGVFRPLGATDPVEKSAWP